MPASGTTLGGAEPLFPDGGSEADERPATGRTGPSTAEDPDAHAAEAEISPDAEPEDDVTKPAEPEDDVTKPAEPEDDVAKPAEPGGDVAERESKGGEATEAEVGKAVGDRAAGEAVGDDEAAEVGGAARSAAYGPERACFPDRLRPPRLTIYPLRVLLRPVPRPPDLPAPRS